MSANRFAVRLLAPCIGAEVTGIDLRDPLDDDTMAELRRVWLDRVVVVFPGQELDDERQIAFSRRVGDLELIRMRALTVEGRPEVYRATNLDKAGRIMAPDDPVMQTNRDNARWHSDSSFKAVPADASLLRAVEVPGKGGATSFANMVAAYDALDPDDAASLEGLVGVHDFYWSRRDVGQDAFTDAERAAIPPVRHPVIRVHPETGRKAIYVGSHTREIEGMSWDDGRALIDRLIEHATRPRFTYTHRWSVGDLVWWDNRAALHQGQPFDEMRERRLMHRTTVAGAGPTL